MCMHAFTWTLTGALACPTDRLDVDPTEHVNLASNEPERLRSMLRTLAWHNQSTFSPYRGPWDAGACKAALGKYDGFWGPWVP